MTYPSWFGICICLPGGVLTILCPLVVAIWVLFLIIRIKQLERKVYTIVVSYNSDKQEPLTQSIKGSANLHQVFIIINYPLWLIPINMILVYLLQPFADVG